MPTDYPDWRSVYYYFRQWRKAGEWRKLNKRRRRRLRKKLGRHGQASAACLDSQSVKSGCNARAKTGFDAGKKVWGRKRHILVDTLGLLITVVVHAADISETAGGPLVLMELVERWWRRKLIWLDGGYLRGLLEWAAGLKRWRRVKIEQVKRSDGQKGFQVLPKRWIVERTFGWLTKQRRLSRTTKH